MAIIPNMEVSEFSNYSIEQMSIFVIFQNFDKPHRSHHIDHFTIIDIL